MRKKTKKKSIRKTSSKENAFLEWFNYKKYPEYKFKCDVFLMDFLYFIASLIFFLIMYKNVDLLNEYNFFIRIGSIILIIATLIFINFLFKILNGIKNAIKGLQNGYKMIIAIIFVILLLLIYFNQEQCIMKIKEKLDMVDFSDYNPIALDFGEKLFLEEITSDMINEETKKIERGVLTYVNVERHKNQLPELVWNKRLSSIARAHSLDMAENNFFDHVNLDGKDYNKRAIDGGFTQKKILSDGSSLEGVSENIGKLKANFISDDANVAQVQVEYWMNSTGHRKNILNPQHSDLGVGVVFDGEEYIFTQVFW